MAGGRPPKPMALRVMTSKKPGTDSAGRPLPKIAPFDRVAPEPPYWLEDEAKAEWNRVVPELARLGILKSLDAAVVALYCTTWARYVAAQLMVQREGILTTNSQGRVRHPAVMIVESASRELRQLANELGLTPASEHKVGPGAAGAADEGENPFASAV